MEGRTFLAFFWGSELPLPWFSSGPVPYLPADPLKLTPVRIYGIMALP